MRQIFATLLIAFSITACSFWIETDSNLVTVDSSTTATPTATVQPPLMPMLLLEVEVEATAVPDLDSTPTSQPFININIDPDSLPWFPLVVP